MGSTLVQDHVYAPDPAGMVTQVTSPFPDEGWSCAYDDLHRLTTATSLSDTAPRDAAIRFPAASSD